MKLLVITERVDSGPGYFGYFVDWLREFAQNCDSVLVICQSMGQYDLPKNVIVKSLGKEAGSGKLTQLLLFYSYVFKHADLYDAVFVHMSPTYVILAGLYWRFMDKRIALWYTHKHVDLKLRIAEKFVNIIFTASSESFRLKSSKVHVMGHGINTLKYAHSSLPWVERSGVISVGRISKVKNIEILIEVMRGIDENCLIIGNPMTRDDEIYYSQIKKSVPLNVRFMGPVANDSLSIYLGKVKVFVNLSSTGSLDKAILEAMAGACLPLTSNEAFKSILSQKYLTTNNPKEISAKLKFLLSTEPDSKLSDYVVLNHSLSGLIPRIVKAL
ncbi:MAG TPA: glycosyltransferase [Candidatus Paceibacterota bacterium]